MQTKMAILLAFAVIGIASCSGQQVCKTDACYRERAASIDPFEKGEVVAWGVTEKQDREEEQGKRELASEKAGKR